MGLANAPIMPVATLTEEEPIHVASVAEEIPITDEAEIPVATGTKLTNTDEAAFAVAGGPQIPVAPRIHHQWISESVAPCEG